jgi:hypothetical protein
VSESAKVVLGRVLINSFCQRGWLNVRFGPKATELLHRRENIAMYQT